MFERVEMVDTKSLKSKDDIVATNQICVTETKNLVAEQQTIEVPRRNEENRGKIVEHAFWMPTHDKKDPLSGRPHLEYSDKRLAARAAGFPVAYDSGKRLAVSAVEFPVVLANLEAKLDALYGQFERLAAANERLTDMMLGRTADLEEPDPVEVVEGQKKLGDYVR